MKRLLLLIALLAWAGSAYCADTTYYVDTDVVGGTGDGSSWANAFSSMYSAEALNLNLTTGGTQGVCTINFRGTAADVTRVSFAGWTTSGIYKIILVGDFKGTKYDATKYHLAPSSTGVSTLAIGQEGLHIEIRNMQIGLNSNGQYRYAVTHSGYEGGSLTIHDCFIYAITSGTDNHGIDFGTAGQDKIYNNIVVGFTGTNSVGIYLGSGGATHTVYANNVYGCTVGIQRANGTATLKNNAVFNCTTCYTGTFSANSRNNLSSDATGDDFGSGGVASVTIDDTNDVVSLTGGSEDFAIKGTSSDLYGTGVDLYADATIAVTSDITGATLMVRDDIGANEFIPASSVNVMKIILGE